MRPILFEIFGLSAASAPVFAGAAALLAYLYFEYRRADLPYSELDFWGLLGALAVSVGAGSVAGYWLITHGDGRLIWWDGGLGLQGGTFLGSFPAAILAAWLYARARRLPFAPAADLLAGAAPLGLVAMRIGCLLNGCCHGAPAIVPWAVTFTGRCAVPFELRGIPLHPSQLYEAAGALAIFFFIERWARPRLKSGVLRPGDALWLSAGLYAVLRFFADFTKAPYPAAIVTPGLALSQWACLAAAAAAALHFRKAARKIRLGERELYGLLIAGLFAGVALWRRDLFLGAWHATLGTLARGGPARWKLLGEIFLFSAILLVTWREIPAITRPARDAWIVVLGAALGWAAEAWGTRLDIWRYYTGETPPAWIVAVWPLGALLVDRLAERVRRPVPAGAYWALAALAFALFASFAAPWLTRPAGWGAAALVAAALAAGVKPQEEFWTLAAGMACVFFADLWGTTNDCWRYYLHGEPLGLWRGIAFGMAFDAAVVLATLRLARWLEKRAFYRFLY